jgi:hypothetical protein
MGHFVKRFGRQILFNGIAPGFLVLKINFFPEFYEIRITLFFLRLCFGVLFFSGHKGDSSFPNPYAKG